MKVIGLVFITIMVVCLTFFGTGVITDLDGNVNITADDPNYDNYQTTQNTTVTVLGIFGILPYLLMLGAFIAVLAIVLVLGR